MKKFLTALTILILSSPALAAGQKIDIKVLGMVCDFCAQAVWKVFEDYDAVESVDINLDDGLVTVFLKDGQSLSDDELSKAIEYAGYDLVSISKAQTIQ